MVASLSVPPIWWARHATTFPPFVKSTKSQLNRTAMPLNLYRNRTRRIKGKWWMNLVSKFPFFVTPTAVFFFLPPFSRSIELHFLPSLSERQTSQKDALTSQVKLWCVAFVSSEVSLFFFFFSPHLLATQHCTPSIRLRFTSSNPNCVRKQTVAALTATWKWICKCDNSSSRSLTGLSVARP